MACENKNGHKVRSSPWGVFHPRAGGCSLRGLGSQPHSPFQPHCLLPPAALRPEAPFLPAGNDFTSLGKQGAS